MFAVHLSGSIRVSAMPVTARRSIHAGSTGLTGLTGCVAHMCVRVAKDSFQAKTTNQTLTREELNLVNPVNPVEPVTSLAFSRTGFGPTLINPVSEESNMRIDMRSNIPELEQGVRAFGRQAVFAAAVSLTRSAKDAQGAIREEMRATFDRPTPYALGGLLVQGATKAKLSARVWVKDQLFGKGVPADRFLLPQIHGGPRGQKGLDKALQAAGLLPAGWTAVPAAGAQLDNYGNVRRGQITQMLSQLRVQRRGGYESRASDSAASRRTVARQGVTYFALPEPRRGLKPGIYLKRKFAQGTAIRPVFIFVQAARYQKRLRFFEVGQAVAEHRFGVHFQDELARAVVTMRRR